ncbi:hypothetical protein AH4AK4_2389 [Aeromonas hydrophila 4AK4]|nr:hypothetical protein AH4AK4_2389 [Aeromonas hydrophila 4AK4]
MSPDCWARQGATRLAVPSALLSHPCSPSLCHQPRARRACHRPIKKPATEAGF